MSIGTLADIQTKVRRLTGAGNSLQLTNAMINDYVNSFYQYDFPAQFRSLKLQDKYTFNTVQGIDTYAFNSEAYSTVSMPCYCSKREIQLFQDPWSFYGVNFNWQNIENDATGNGGMGPYLFTVQAAPMIRSINNDPTNINYPAGRVQNILITANTATGTVNVTDDGNGNLIGNVTTTPGTNTINYMTGAVSVEFIQAIPQGNQIQIQYNSCNEAMPLSIMFYQNQFTLRPVPDQGYTIELTAYRLPTQALENANPSGSGTPEMIEWWETLAFGSAKKFYEDRMDPDGVALMDKGLKERYMLNESRTYAQLATNRVKTIYADQLNQSYGAGTGLFGGTSV